MTRTDAEIQRSRRSVDSPQPANGAANLALLYQGLLTAIVRLRDHREQIRDADSFRRRTKAALQDVERDAVGAGYDVNDVKDTHYAVVAFLDSVVLHSTEAVRAEWERETLGLELFGQTVAGDVFFEKLNDLSSRRDTSQVADLLEVYLLCLLLGFQGRYSGPLASQIDGIAENIRRRIEHIRGAPPALSPSAGLTSEPEPTPEPVRPADTDQPLRYAAAASIAAALVLLVLLKADLWRFAAEIRSRFP